MSNTLMNAAVSAAAITTDLITLPFRLVGSVYGRIVAAFSSDNHELSHQQTGANVNIPLPQRTVTQASGDSARSARQAAIAQTLSTVDPQSPTHFSSDINIGVFGAGGHGKSSVINALRNLEDDDFENGAAHVSSVSTNQTETNRYQYSGQTYLCELPDLKLATDNPEGFAQRSGLEDYDALFIVQKDKTVSRKILTLLKQAKNKGIPVYVIRTGFDVEIAGEQRKRAPSTIEQIDNQIKGYITSQFSSEIDPKDIFNCSTTPENRQLYDFPKLQTLMQQIKKR